MPIRRVIGLLTLALSGCGRDASKGGATGTIVVYSALDQEFAEPVLQAYGKRTGVDVVSKFDVESTKTVGLTQLLIQEASRPRCDLFWNNEILNTPTSSPKSFDLIILEGGRRRTYPSGIYSLDDPTFRPCFASLDGRRPTRFATQPGSGRTLFLDQRAGVEKVAGPGRWPESPSMIEMAMRPGEVDVPREVVPCVGD